jgi:hypothetical protein
MIKAQDLRIGNLVYDEFNHVFKIKALLPLSARLCNVRKGVKRLDKGTPFKLIEPIAITEDWLLKFGFSKSVRPNCNDIYKDLIARMILWFNEGNYAEMDLIQDDKWISFKHSHISYVHQLQNLYYCLIGEELCLNSK